MKVPVDSQNQHRAAVCVLFPHLGRRRIVIVLYNLCLCPNGKGLSVGAMFLLMA